VAWAALPVVLCELDPQAVGSSTALSSTAASAAGLTRELRRDFTPQA
jgi:hypothetical protein